jgi:hypothetical protein
MLREVYSQKLSALIGYLTVGLLLCVTVNRNRIKLDADIIDIIIYVFLVYGKNDPFNATRVLFFHSTNHQ